MASTKGISHLVFLSEPCGLARRILSQEEAVVVELAYCQKDLWKESRRNPPVSSKNASTSLRAPAEVSVFKL